jgi:hypothetical protein
LAAEEVKKKAEAEKGKKRGREDSGMRLHENRVV